MRMLEKALTRTVAVRTAPKGSPASERTAGFTRMMYIVARKAVAPARTSVFMSVPLL